MVISTIPCMSSMFPYSSIFSFHNYHCRIFSYCGVISSIFKTTTSPENCIVILDSSFLVRTHSAFASGKLEPLCFLKDTLPLDHLTKQRCNIKEHPSTFQTEGYKAMSFWLIPYSPFLFCLSLILSDSHCYAGFWIFACEHWLMALILKCCWNVIFCW